MSPNWHRSNEASATLLNGEDLLIALAHARTTLGEPVGQSRVMASLTAKR